MAILFRSAYSVFAGVIVALLLVVAVELFSAVVHPFPPGFSGTQDEMCRHVEQYPHWVLAIVAALWGATTFVSTWIAARLGNRVSGSVVGLLLLAAVLFNMAKLPYPLWFEVVNVVVFPLAILLALRWSRRRTTPSTGGASP